MRYSTIRFLVPTTAVAISLALAIGCGSDDAPLQPGDTQSGDAGNSNEDGGDNSKNDASTSSDAGSKDASSEDAGSGDSGSEDSGSDDAGSEDAAATTYAIGGSVSGLLGQGLVLQNNGGDDLTQNADGTFAFATKLGGGAAYAVTVKTQPTTPSQTCAVANGTGTVGAADVSNVAVTCTTDTFTVGGNVSGLPAGTSVVLTNNGGDDLTQNADGAFTFATKVASGAAYEVAVKTQPTGAFCGVASGSGNVTDAAISNVAITCVAATSCKAIKDVAPSAADGVYAITPAGSPTFNAYCEMTTDGGGWTLALKAGGASTVFTYGSSYWTDNATLNETSTDLSQTEAKFASFSTVPFTEVGLAIDTAGTVNAAKFPQANTSLQALFNAGYVATTLGRTAWLNLVPGSALQANCNEEGFNIDHGGYARARIGIIGNQENDCGSPDSFLGIGTSGGQCTGGDATVGNKTGCGPIFDVDGNQVGTDLLIQSFGYLFVR